MTEILIGDRRIGSTAPTFVIAELSANHNHDLGRALASIDAAADAGVDAVKFQTYTADTITIDSDSEPFQVKGGTLWDGRTLYDLYSEAYTPWEWHEELFARAEDRGLIALSTPFDPTAVDLLESLAVPVYKVASMEIVDTPLISLIASKGKPVIISTGIATEDEIADAVAACRSVGNEQVILLHCTSGYPTPPDQLNMLTLPDMRERFGTSVGLSDHTMTHTAAIVGVSFGATIIEKHFTLDRGAGGPDSTFSLEPDELAELVALVRETEEALGRVTYELAPSARTSRAHSRSLFVVANVRAGDVVTTDNVRSIRPADGLHPAKLDDLVGKRFLTDAPKGTPMTLELVESS
ncbi:MAG: pseudaminic acid synthase [Actinomycetota bacterium]